MMYTPEKFSLAVSGNGLLTGHFVSRLKKRFPRVLIYDRNEEANRPPSDSLYPWHPDVADIDALFILLGNKETATIRNFNGHRFFNYESGDGVGHQAGMDLLMSRMVQAVEQLISWEVPDLPLDANKGVEIEFEEWGPDAEGV